jgi:hypothetical protein
MRSLVQLCGLAVLFVAGAARAEAPASLLVHVEISDGEGHARSSADHAVFIADSEWGELHADSPGAASTHVKLRVVDRPAGPTLLFDVQHVDADKASYSARGSIALPPPGRRVVVARVPRRGGDAEIALSIAPASK